MLLVNSKDEITSKKFKERSEVLLMFYHSPFNEMQTTSHFCFIILQIHTAYQLTVLRIQEFLLQRRER